MRTQLACFELLLETRILVKLLFITVEVSQNGQTIRVIQPKITIKPYVFQKQICHI